MTTRREKPGEELLTVSEAAREFKLHPDTIRRWVRKGSLRAVRIGPHRFIRLRRSDIVEIVGSAL